MERIKEIFMQKDLLRRMVIKELKAKYVGSILGISWAIITPFLIMAAISFVFTKIMKVDVRLFPLFVLSAILPWTFFSASLTEATTSVINNSHLLRQFNISKVLIPLSSVLANFINFLFGLIFMVLIFIVFRTEVIFCIWVLPLILVFHLLFTAGLGLFLSCVNVYYRDVSHLLGVGLLFWFWVTPIFYSLNTVPQSYRWICMLNPMTVFIVSYRNILFDARVPSLSLILVAFFTAVVFFLLGYGIFVKYESSFIKRV